MSSIANGTMVVTVSNHSYQDWVKGRTWQMADQAAAHLSDPGLQSPGPTKPASSAWDASSSWKPEGGCSWLATVCLSSASAGGMPLPDPCMALIQGQESEGCREPGQELYALAQQADPA